MWNLRALYIRTYVRTYALVLFHVRTSRLWLTVLNRPIGFCFSQPAHTYEYVRTFTVRSPFLYSAASPPSLASIAFPPLNRYVQDKSDLPVSFVRVRALSNRICIHVTMYFAWTNLVLLQVLYVHLVVFEHTYDFNANECQILTDLTVKRNRLNLIIHLVCTGNVSNT